MDHRIVVPINETRYALNALQAGSALASQLGNSLTVLSVVADKAHTGKRRDELQSTMQKHHDGAEISVVAHPDPTARLIEETRGTPQALLCMATHARGPVSELLLGSVASNVLRQSDQPVVLTGPRLSLHWAAPIRTVVLCVDESPESALVLETAGKLASALGADVQLVRTVSVPSESLKEGSNWFTGSDWHTSTGRQDPQFEPPTQSRHWELLKQRAAEMERITGREAGYEVLLSDNPAAAVVDYADAQPGPLLVTGTHAGSAIKRLILGSYASAVVQGARCPVMIVPE